LPSEFLSRRPDIRRAEVNLAADDANVARANPFPSINLTEAMGAQSSALPSLLNAPNLVANVSASLMAPIFDGGGNPSQDGRPGRSPARRSRS
jgi:outer membrane protein TolC